jgi:hypothetical protein
LSQAGCFRYENARKPHGNRALNGAFTRKLAPGAGFEPATIRLTVGCSTAELSRNDRLGRIAWCTPRASPKRECGAKGGAKGGPRRSAMKDLEPLNIFVSDSTAGCKTLHIIRHDAGCGCSIALAIGEAVRSADQRPRGGVVTQRTANPCTPVRFRARPPALERNRLVQPGLQGPAKAGLSAWP